MMENSHTTTLMRWRNLTVRVAEKAGCLRFQETARNVSCFDAYLIVKGHSKLRDNPSNSQPDAGKLNLRTYGYGGTGCDYPGRRCGPNYCCCWGF
ncbi:Hypothetical predicted protein [Mytilus galloprovincialis]|uniref:Uncharacterized protein n=1 Tax=Mytilus galloprovincialis TaxID=29158 RepID=A0A8B6GUN4_MYTGA|nr:Hypothetical predicted protein [Mytilus galloprovincialis]